MRTKKTGYFLSALLLFSTLLCSVGASLNTTASFHGGGVTVNLIFPEEAHPKESIWHNLTISALTAATLRNFTVVIEAPVNSGWVEILNSQDTFSKLLPVTYNLDLLLPQETNGTLQCSIYLNTSSIGDLAIAFYTTQVREMTYSELLEGYNVLNSTYNQLIADYDTLNNTYNNLHSSYETLNAFYNELIEDYNVLNSTYNQLFTDHEILKNTYNILQSSYAALNASYNELSGNYSILNNNYNDLLGKYSTLNNNYDELDSRYASVNSDHNSLLEDYSQLQSDYEDLNSTRYNLLADKESLQAFYDDLNETYTNLLADYNKLQTDLNKSVNDLNTNGIVMFIFIIVLVALIAFIIYLKRGKEEPYVVIRKETVSMKEEDHGTK